jgi:hypothetical protein
MGVGIGIFLIAVGAILAFAVRTEPSGLDLDATGWILIVAGLAVVILSLAFWSYRRYARVIERETYTPAYPPTRVVYPPTTGRIVERRVYPPVTDRIVEREVPRYPTDRVIEHDVYDDGFPP